jgi:hypothetical protein
MRDEKSFAASLHLGNTPDISSVLPGDPIISESFIDKRIRAALALIRADLGSG